MTSKKKTSDVEEENGLVKVGEIRDVIFVSHEVVKMGIRPPQMFFSQEELIQWLSDNHIITFGTYKTSFID